MTTSRLGIAAALAFAFAFVGCVTTEEDSVAVSTPHLGEEPQFIAADVDKNGHLTKQEVAAHHHEELLALYDLDRDSHISEAEWKSAHPTAAELDPKFNAIDRNKDKRVTKAEAIKWVSEHVTFTKSFAKYDMDGDSRLYWKDIDAMAPTELRVTMFSLPIG